MNEFGALGVPQEMAACYHNTLGCSPAPVPVSGGISFSTISPRLYTTCGLGTDGLVYCWGSNAVGQLGDGTFDNRSVPAPIGGQP